MQIKEFSRLVEQLRKRDTLVRFSLSRLGRKTKDLIELIEKFNIEGINLISLKESTNTTSLIGRAMIDMISIFTELERELITERVKEGIRNTRARLGGKSRINSEKEKRELFILKTTKKDIIDNFTLNSEEIAHIGRLKKPYLKLGYKLQYLLLKNFGRQLNSDISLEILNYIGE